MSKEPRKLELSTTQVVASALAAIAAAAASARLGVAGTFIGAGVVSVVATISSAIVGHSLRRTNDRMRTVVKTRAELARDGRGQAQRIPMLGRIQPTQPLPRAGDRQETGRTDAADLGVPPVDSATQGADSAADQDPTPSVPTVPTEAESVASRFASVRWKPVAAVCLLVFAFAVVGITVIELIGGRTLHDLESGKQGSGTSLSHVVSPGAPARRSTPTPTPSGHGTGPTRSPSSRPSESPSSTPSSSPTSRPTQPPSSQPSQTSSGSPTPIPSRSPSSGPPARG